MNFSFAFSASSPHTKLRRTGYSFSFGASVRNPGVLGLDDSPKEADVRV